MSVIAMSQTTTNLAPNLGAVETVDIKPMADWCPCSDPGHVRDPYVSPFLSTDLSGLSPPDVVSAGYDPLRNDAELRIRQLQEAGVPATCTPFPGRIHRSCAFTKVMASSRAWRVMRTSRSRPREPSTGDGVGPIRS